MQLEINKGILAIVILLMTGGLIATSYLAHEISHIVLTPGEASALCVNFNTKINDTTQSGWLIMSTTTLIEDHENLEAYQNWRVKTEDLIEGVMQWTLIFVASISFFIFGRSSNKPKRDEGQTNKHNKH